MNPNWKIDTIAVQGGYEPKSGEPRILPIIQSTTFKYDSAEHVTKLFDLEAAGFFYTRLANPTTDGFETKIAQMEGGVGAMATSSGQAATTLAILNICQAGQHVVSASSLYGGTYNLFAHTLPQFGIEVRFADPDKPEEWTYIEKYSPYHNVVADKKYPRVLFTTSTRDDRVHPGHARKMAARMLAQGHEVMYYENIEGGHGGAADNKQLAYMSTLAYTFLVRELFAE